MARRIRSGHYLSPEVSNKNYVKQQLEIKLRCKPHAVSRHSSFVNDCHLGNQRGNECSGSFCSTISGSGEHSSAEKSRYLENGCHGR